MSYTCPACFKTSHTTPTMSGSVIAAIATFSGIGRIGRELKVSELRPETVVWVAKMNRPTVSMWVVWVYDVAVHFRAGEAAATPTNLPNCSNSRVNTWSGQSGIFRGAGPGLEQITDDSHIPMKVFEYLGEV